MSLPCDYCTHTVNDDDGGEYMDFEKLPVSAWICYECKNKMKVELNEDKQYEADSTVLTTIIENRKERAIEAIEAYEDMLDLGDEITIEGRIVDALWSVLTRHNVLKPRNEDDDDRIKEQLRDEVKVVLGIQPTQSKRRRK